MSNSRSKYDYNECKQYKQNIIKDLPKSYYDTIDYPKPKPKIVNRRRQAVMATRAKRR